MREKGKGYLPRMDEGLILDREETHMNHRQMTVYKGKRKLLYSDGFINFSWTY